MPFNNHRANAKLLEAHLTITPHTSITYIMYMFCCESGRTIQQSQIIELQIMEAHMHWRMRCIIVWDMVRKRACQGNRGSPIIQVTLTSYQLVTSQSTTFRLGRICLNIHISTATWLTAKIEHSNENQTMSTNRAEPSWFDSWLVSFGKTSTSTT